MSGTEATKAAIDDIIVVSNPRTDFSQVPQLAASIKEVGIKIPLLVRQAKQKGKWELIDGECRLRAAQQVGLKEVPIKPEQATDEEVAETKLVTVLQRDELNPIDQAKAFENYIKAHKRSAEYLAKRIGKPAGFIQKRLLLLKLSSDVQAALLKGTITVKHATILAQLSKESQSGILKEVVSEKMTPQELVDNLSFADLKTEDLPDEVKAKVSQRKQTTLEDIGDDINEASIAKNAKRELGAYLDRERKKLQEQKIIVFASHNDLKKAHPKAEKVSEYSYENKGKGYDYHDIVKDLPGSKTFGVVVEWNGHYLNKTVYCLDPQAYAEQRKEKAVKAKKKATPAQEEATAQQLSLDRKERLKRKVADYKHEWLRTRTVEAIKDGGKVDAAIRLYTILEVLGPTSESYREVGIKYNISSTDLKRFLGWTPKQIADATRKALDEFIAGETLDWLKEASSAAGLDYAKTFEITDEYLELYTISDLQDLIKELKLKGDDGIEYNTKQELIDLVRMRTKGKKGLVPKIFEKA